MIRKILHIILNIISVIVSIFLFIVLYAWLQVNVFNSSYANVFGFTMFDVVTGSMSGTIEVNDYVLVKTSKNIDVRDIITFKDGDNFITHRVVEIKGDKIITRGDANNSDDKEITYEDIVGKVIMVIPNAGVWKDVFLDKKVFIPVILTLVLFVVFFSIEEKRYKKVIHKGNMELLKNNKSEVKRKEVKVKARLDMLKNEEKDKNK